MLFIMYTLVALVFPSLIIYSPLPGEYFSDTSLNQEAGIAFAAFINVGLYLLFNGIGALVVAYCYNQN